MDLSRQIEYWRHGADEDFEVAKELLAGKRYRHALFFAHLALEKMLKAHVTQRTGQIPPRIHNLVRLSQVADMSLSFDPTRIPAGIRPVSDRGAISVFPSRH